MKILKALEPKTPCSKMSFLQSLMPHLTNYSNSEFLQFQMEVLNVIDNINKMKQTVPHPQPTYSSSMPPYLLFPQSTPQPSPVIQPQSFLNIRQPSFPPQQCAGPSFSRQITTGVDEHSLYQHRPICGLQNHSKEAQHSTPPQKSTQSKPETQTTSHDLHEIVHSDSPQSENVASLSTSPSGNSSYSDFFN